MKLAVLTLVGSVLLVPRGPSMGEAFRLTVGESASIEEADLALLFVDVTGDSRCPRDVTCIVAGEAVVVIDATTSEESETLTFRVPPGNGDTREFSGLRIEILGLEPQTDSRRRIDPSSYEATIVVTAQDAKGSR